MTPRVPARAGEPAKQPYNVATIDNLAQPRHKLLMDVVDLREFYAGRLGRTVHRCIAGQLAGRWPDVRGACVLGLGYALPYLDHWQGQADRVFGFMPARLGVLHWPDEAPGQSVLVDESALPLADGSVDFALVVHGLELAEQYPHMLSELWRVLGPRGRALFVVPNRRGLWSRLDTTPFGHGQPFTRAQLDRTLRQARFSPQGWSHVLFAAPLDRSLALKAAPVLERAGKRLWPGFSGVLIVEATKQIYSLAKTSPAGARLPYLVPAPGLP